MPYDFKDLPKKSGTPGIGANVYLIPDSWIDTRGAAGTGTVPGDTTVMGTIAPVSGKGFIKLYTTQSVSDFNGKTVGEEDSETMEWDLNFQNPGLDPVIAEFIKNAQGETWTAVVKPVNCADGPAYLFGTNCAPLKLSFEVSSGTANSGSKSVKVKGKWYHPYPLFTTTTTPLFSEV